MPLTAALLSNDGLVSGDTDLSAAGDGTGDDDGQGALLLGSSDELVGGLDGDGVTTGTTSGTSVLRAVADVASLGGLAASKLVASTEDVGRRSRGQDSHESNGGELHLDVCTGLFGLG